MIFSPISFFRHIFRLQTVTELGVLPRIKGLYEWDFPEFDAIIISHAYLDYYGLLKYVHPEIPVYVSAGTQKLNKITREFIIFDFQT